MKLTSIISFSLICILFFSCKKEEDVNYKVTEAVSLFENTKSLNTLASSTTGNYVKVCPNGYTGCGATSGIVCESSQQPCVIPVVILRKYPCPGSNLYGCKSGLQTGAICETAQACAGENHPSPCNYGGIAFGCFAGAPISGPSCGTLVNCETPPD
ncbi:hypothetical protein ACFE6N_09070 [Pedobacter sp. BG31]|uniref:hypothetical protein n=1 Tax=Pedobacter sp. BG31 TaxID=3349697 RepID=UPI0035F3805F